MTINKSQCQSIQRIGLTSFLSWAILRGNVSGYFPKQFSHFGGPCYNFRRVGSVTGRLVFPENTSPQLPPAPHEHLELVTVETRPYHESVLDRRLDSASTLAEVLTAAVAPCHLPAHESEELTDLRNEVSVLQARCDDAERGLATEVQLRTKAEADNVRANEDFYTMNNSNGSLHEENAALATRIRDQDMVIARQTAALKQSERQYCAATAAAMRWSERLKAGMVGYTLELEKLRQYLAEHDRGSILTPSPRMKALLAENASLKRANSVLHENSADHGLNTDALVLSTAGISPMDIQVTLIIGFAVGSRPNSAYTSWVSSRRALKSPFELPSVFGANFLAMGLGQLRRQSSVLCYGSTDIGFKSRRWRMLSETSLKKSDQLMFSSEFSLRSEKSIISSATTDWIASAPKSRAAYGSGVPRRKSTSHDPSRHLPEPTYLQYSLEVLDWAPMTDDWIKELRTLNAMQPWWNSPFNTTYAPCNFEVSLIIPRTISRAHVISSIVVHPSLEPSLLTAFWVRETLVNNSDLLKKLLETELIEYSDSEWAPPIVIVTRKNGVDIRLCIDYRLENQMIKLMYYPLPLSDALLIGFENVMWFLSLDTDNGFWAVPMTHRAQPISGFVCPLGHFQWNRMPFGLKNAPLIYQQVCIIVSGVLGAFRPKKKLRLGILGIKSENKVERRDLSPLTVDLTMFRRNIPAPAELRPVLGRNSYMDNITYGAETWDQIQIYDVKNLPFSTTLKGVQSFLRSLNYYNKFIEDLSVVVAVLYELTDEQIRMGKKSGTCKGSFCNSQAKNCLHSRIETSRQKETIHYHPTRKSLGSECGVGSRVRYPVRFTGRVLHDQELRYHPAEKEIVGLLRVLRVFYPMLTGNATLKVYTRYSVLGRLFKSKALEGSCEQWAARLAPWPLEMHKIQNDEDGLASILGAGITPRDKLDQIAENLIPTKGRVVRAPSISLEMLESGYEGWHLSFNGSARTSDRLGSSGCILWKLPTWEVVATRGFHFQDITVNEAEYHGMIESLKMALDRDPALIVVGDSQIAIPQAQGLIQHLNPRLQLLLAPFERLRRDFKSVRLVHVKREYNAAADYVMGKNSFVPELRGSCGRDCVSSPETDE
ncbi:reverse transcriptase [Phytophthora megakarya]|uniref:Reverse transcriptase n=1 Tax=Phytophthora megakarya TaxID=4795 RepID=A0A225WZH6_9STRA|nr:reverse transcriptase [Phytophthora megakarya]